MSSPSPCPEVLAFLHGCLGALLDDCNKVGDHAAYGRYIHDLDDFLYIEGRKFMREVLEKQVQKRIQTADELAERMQDHPDVREEFRKAQDDGMLGYLSCGGTGIG